MKKFGLALCLVMIAVLSLSVAGCKTMENGVEIKYASISLSYTDIDGNSVSEDVTVKLYTNYAPRTIAHFIDLCGKGFYDNSVVSHVESSWFALGGFKLNGDALEKLTSGKTVNGEFSANGFTGNKLNVKKGSVVMYRKPTTAHASNYNTADCMIAICTSTAAPFTASEYCVIGEITDGTQLENLSKISALASRTEEEETVYNRYYAGGIAELAAGYLDENGSLTREAAEKNIDLEDIEKVIAGGEYYREAGKISDEDYDDFIEIARTFVNAASDKLYEYFYVMPVNTVKVTGTKIGNKA